MPTVTLAGVTAIAVNCGVAVPLSVTICGLLFAVSVIVRVPLRTPVAVGANATLMTQLAPAVRLAGQALVCVKSVLVTMLPIVKADVPLFFSVTLWVELVVATACEANERDVGNAVACGMTPLPVKLTVIGLMPWSTLTTSVPG